MRQAIESAAIPDDVRLEPAPCPLGCARESDLVLTGRDRMHGLPGRFHVVRCRRCGLMRTDPRPTAASIGFYYPSEYGPFHTPVVPERERAGPRAAKPPTLRRRLLRPWRDFKHRLFRHGSQEIPPLPPGRLLEIGCASGAFLRRQALLGWTVQAIEPSVETAASVAALGYPVHAGSIDSAPEPAAPYDLIALWMVFEHLHDLLGALRRLRGWARPEGWLALSVPDAGGLEFRIFGADWYALQLPTHLYHFTPRTLARLLAAAGWRLERLSWHRNPKNLLVSLHYKMKDRGHRRLADWLLDVGENRRQRRLRSWLGLLLGGARQSGRMTVWALPA